VKPPGVFANAGGGGARTIEGVSTSTAGFVGETERGPDAPTLVTGWAEFERWFGAEIDGPPFGRAGACVPYAVRGFFENGGSRLYIARVVSASATSASLVLPGPGGTTTVRAIGAGRWGNDLFVSVGPSPGDVPRANGSFSLRVRYEREAGAVGPERPAGVVVEEFDDLSDDPASPRFAMRVVNGGSRLVEIAGCVGVPSPVPLPGARLAGGSDAPLTRADYRGTAAGGGLAALARVPEIAIVAIPDESADDDLAADLLDHCEALRTRFGLLSLRGPRVNVVDVRPIRDSAHGAVYHPYLRVAAPHLPGGARLVPPAGHVAGVYARTDLERGVHRAPANEAVRGLSGAGGEAPLSQPLTEADRETLKTRGVNVIRDFRNDGRDVRVWGARTLSTDATWRYVNVRRLFLFIEHSIDRGTQWVAFEPNTEATWAALRASVGAFLHALWRSGALMGMTPEDAFFVRCDRTTMTQQDIDEGRLVCLIGAAPVRPAEFVILRLARLLTP
jgi:phage tail sheath protein FI